MIKTNFILYSLLSLAFLSSASMAMEEERGTAKSQPLKIMVRNDMEKGKSSSNGFSDIALRVAPNNPERNLENLVSQRLQPLCFYTLPKIEIPNEPSALKSVVGSAATTKVITIYPSATFNKERELLNPLIINLGEETSLKMIAVRFYGMQEKKLDGMKYPFPQLSIRINNIPHDFWPQNMFDLESGKELPLGERVESQKKKMRVALKNMTGERAYGLEPSLQQVCRYEDFSVKIVLERAGVSQFTPNDFQELNLPAPAHSVMEKGMVENKPTQYVSARLYARKNSLSTGKEDERSLFGVYELDLGESSDISFVQVNFAKDKELVKNLWIPDILFKVNGKKNRKVPQKFFSQATEYQIN